MESRFAHLRQRDASVSMLRTKLSRRRSQSQKENRERTVNTRRQLSALDKIEEMKPASSKVEDRLKQLERWKERKALEKEKSKRDKERKGVFKTGLYHPKDSVHVAPPPDVPAASTRAKGKKADPPRSGRVTRSMRQQPLRMEDPNVGPRKAPAAVERSSRTRGAAGKPPPAAAKTNTCGAVRPPSARSATRPPAAAARPEEDRPKSKAAGGRTTRSRAADRPAAPPGGGNQTKETVELKEETPLEAAVSHQEEVPGPPGAGARPREDEAMAVEPVDPARPSRPSRVSFAPAGFVFQAPAGLPAFKFDPMTPRSADAFLTPSPTLSLSPPPNPDAPPAPPGEASPSGAPCSPPESRHDVPYFRSQVVTETERLTTLSLRWESKVEDESIPEEMRDGMRTAVGQARLLMKERFKQFSGLVDDCELRRGDKVTTCSDLQGFWDMVSYQVEDVHKKFDALGDAEGRGWAEERRPPPRQRKAVKKPAAAAAKSPGGKAAAAKSRLAAVKAAMKARRQAEEGGKAEDDVPPNPGPAPPSPGPQRPGRPGSHGGFLAVESPVKPPGSVRRSSRLSAAAPPPPSNCSTYLSPRRVTRRSLALVQTPTRLPASPTRLPASLTRLPASPTRLPASPTRLPASPTRLPASPARPPASPTRLPASPTRSPAPPTRSPAPPTRSPAPQTRSPASQTRPTSPTRSPASPTRSPAPPTRSPAPPTRLPASPTRPTSPTRSPSSPTRSPASPTRSPASPAQTPPQLRLLLQQTPAPGSPGVTPLGSDSLCFSPVNEAFSGAGPAGQEVSGCVPPLSAPRHTLPTVAVEMETTETVGVRHAAGPPADSLSLTPDALPGLDFERYLRPSLRGSPSPLLTDCSDVWSPAATADVEMTSPTGERDDPAARGAAATPATSSVLSFLSPQVPAAAASPMLLFTPDIKDKIRQSVCPTDLMVFTPPSL